MKLKRNHGIHIGYINNPGRLNDINLNNELNNRSISTISNSMIIAGNDFNYHKDTFDEKRHYVQNIFKDLHHAIEWTIHSNTNIQWLVLFAAGTYFNNFEPLHTWLELLPKADDTKVGAYAHLMIGDDYKNFEIHHQMIAINAHVARDLKFDIKKYLNTASTTDIKIQKSKGDYHDRYTPHYVFPGETRKMGTTKTSSWLVPFLNNGYTIMNFSGETIRQCKHFFYMDTHKQVKLGQSYLNKDEPSKIIEQAKSIGKLSVTEELLKIDQPPNISVCMYTNTNSSYLSSIHDFEYDVAIVPCAGFNFWRLFEKNNKFSFLHYDISSGAVAFRENLIQDWNGLNFSGFLEKKRKNNVHYVGDMSKVSDINQWEKIKDNNHEYMICDLANDWQLILEKSLKDGHKTILFDVSNILSYISTIKEKGIFNPTQIFKNIVDYLDSNFDDWLVKTDFFSYSKSDLLFYKKNPIDEAKHPLSAFGYFAHNTNVKVPVAPHNIVWNNANANYEYIFNKIKYTSKLNIKNVFHHAHKWNTFEEFYDKNYLPYISIPLNFNTDQFLAEAMHAYEKGMFTTHREDAEHGWSSFVIHGLGFGKTKSFESYFPDAVKSYEKFHFIDEARSICPSITNYFEHEFSNIVGVDQFSRIRIMALEPGGFIPPHYDSLSLGPGPLNIAINNPTNCHFHMWHGSNFTPEGYYGILPFKPGIGLNIDVGNSHMVYNLSNEVRFHIIAHPVINNNNWRTFNIERTHWLKQMENSNE